MMQTGTYFVGVDLGQQRDYTAVAAVEWAHREGEMDLLVRARPAVPVLRLRYLERAPLGTPYPAVVERVRRVTRSAELRERCHVIPDATGVGRPVVELLQRAELGGQVLPVLITGGDTENYSDGYYRVPKRDLVVGLQVLVQRGGLQIADGLELGEALVREMSGMRVKVTVGGREQYGAWREGEHDDLVFAVALACWGARHVGGREVLGDDTWWRRTDQGIWDEKLNEAMKALRART